MQCVRIYITSCVITLHRRPEKTERKCVRKRQERKKNKGRKRKGKRREHAGQTRAWRYALPHGRKGKTVIMQSWERAAFVPPLMCPFVTGGGFLFMGIIGSRNPLGRHTGAWFSRQILFYVDLYLCVVGRFAC